MKVKTLLLIQTVENIIIICINLKYFLFHLYYKTQIYIVYNKKNNTVHLFVTVI